jgi:hypothetical protein
VKIGRWPSVAFNKKNNRLLSATVYDDHGGLVALIEDNNDASPLTPFPEDTDPSALALSSWLTMMLTAGVTY